MNLDNSLTASVPQTPKASFMSHVLSSTSFKPTNDQVCTSLSQSLQNCVTYTIDNERMHWTTWAEHFHGIHVVRFCQDPVAPCDRWAVREQMRSQLGFLVEALFRDMEDEGQRRKAAHEVCSNVPIYSKRRGCCILHRVPIVRRRFCSWCSSGQSSNTVPFCQI